MLARFKWCAVTALRAVGASLVVILPGLTVVVFMLAVALFLVALELSPIARDDSDQSATGPRSGLTPRIDHLTGCQYLEASNGGLTPRIDREGRHLGCR